MFNQRALKDRYGFIFWLKWILWFAGSFILAAVFWTAFLTVFFGRITGAELTITWCVAVFGSWFLLVIPFMRKKEQIWKRLNEDQEKAVDAWFLGMSFFIWLLIASSFLWSLALKDRLLLEDSHSLDPLWAKRVFTTWLLVALPFLILMYRQADRIFKNAVVRQTYTPKFKSISVDRSKRLLPENMADKVKSLKPALPRGHVVTVILKGGERVPNVFVLNAREILGVYDRIELGFEAQDIVDIEKVDPDGLPAFEESKWLRLDGQG